MKKTEETKTTTAANGVKLVKPFNKEEKAETKTAKTETNPASQSAETPKKEFPKAEETPTAAPTAEYETPKPQSIEELQKMLSEEIERINRKKGIAKKRGVFIESLENLETFTRKLTEDEGFETNCGKIQFQIFETDKDYPSRQSYKDMFSISNGALILKFAEMLAGEVRAKITELETQLLQP
ncbi:hypothetical protein LJC53_04850 [Bacteroidales bacterium OttesenSCG-928-C03]|nr:hypothetical protein [Bacteroidales bacterium OttesenSCG-928-C03]MDL2326131.1 hypothetical protein [Bacteroidales bacterium OttesenSCG-928-A14]